MRQISIACTLLALGFVATGFAQQPVYWGDEGIEPKNPMPTRFGDGILYVMVVVPNAPLLPDYRVSATQVAHKTVFREVFVAFRQDISREFYLVRTKGEPFVWGWMDKKYLLSDLQCKRSEDKNNPTAFIKVAIKNNLRVDLSEKVDVRSGPGSNFSVVETNGLAQILYVYDLAKDGAGTEYLLLGWDAEWDPERPADSIRGWVRKDQCTIWDSRVAVYYNRKNIGARKPVSIFRTVNDLISFQKTGDTSGALSVEAANSDKSLTYDRSRFPVLSYGPMMKVAFIGAPPDLKISVAEANLKVEQVRNMQVLFIIDGTISMGRYFQQVQKAVREYIDTLPTSQEKARNHFAAAVYRDYEDGPNGEMEFVADFDDQKAMEKLGSVQERSSPDDHTFEEAVFNGIIRAVKRASWKPGMLKVVVVIGDDPNHSPDTDRNKYTAQSVVKALKELPPNLRSGFRFHAINVNVTDSHRQLNDEFVNQMKQIGNQFKPEGTFRQIKTEQGDLDQFRQAVTGALRNVIKTSESVDSAVGLFKQGESFAQVSAKYGTELTRLAISLLGELGVNPDVIDTSHISQISQEGWVQMSSNGQQLMEPWVYIERREMDEFKGFLASLMSSSEQKQRASQIIKDAVNRVSGDPLLNGETIADYVKRAFALPFREDSTILSKTPEQLQQALGDQGYWSQFRKRVGYSYAVLGLVSEQLDPSFLRWDETKKIWERMPGSPQMKSWVTSAGGQTFCWIPLEFMP